jgi:DNA-nicking Smr family endonuclease
MVDERWNLRIKAMNTDDMAMGRRVDRLSGLIKENLSLLGFTPTDRTRLGIARVKARSKLEDLIARANSHGAVAAEVADGSTRGRAQSQ